MSKSKVAIIGLGNIGNAIVTNLVKGNREVIIADRKEEKSQQLATKLGQLAQPMSIGAAIKEADVIIFSVWFNAIRELIEQYNTLLEGKVIVDPSNPIAPDEKGGFKKIINVDQSAGQINSSYLPKNAKLAKALGTLSVASLQDCAFKGPEKSVLFYAADDKNINGIIEALIRDIGFEPLRVGGIDQSIRIEVFGDLHEFGALGKTVTLNEVDKAEFSIN